MKLETTKIPTTHNDHGGAETLTVGSIRRLLQKAAGLPARRPRVADCLTNGQLIAAIRGTLAGRPSGGPVSLLVAVLAERLAGLTSVFMATLCRLPGDDPNTLARPRARRCR